MCYRCLAICSLFLFVRSTAADAARERLLKEWERLIGTWELVEFVLEGEQKPTRRDDGAPVRIRITRQGIMERLEDDVPSSAICRLIIRPEQTPKRLEIEFLARSVRGTKAVAIYELDGERFRYCTSRTDAFPRQIHSTTQGGGRSVEVWRRVKKEP